MPAMIGIIIFQDDTASFSNNSLSSVRDPKWSRQTPSPPTGSLQARLPPGAHSGAGNRRRGSPADLGGRDPLIRAPWKPLQGLRQPSEHSGDRVMTGGVAHGWAAWCPSQIHCLPEAGLSSSVPRFPLQYKGVDPRTSLMSP